MKVLVIGASGQIGGRIIKKLKNSNHQAIAMIRDEKQKPELQAQGAQTVVADLEGDISSAFESGPDAIIFTAGSGGDTGRDKTTEIDLKGARKSIDEAKKHKVGRYIMISALGANNIEEMPEEMRHYFVAKSEADQHLVQSSLNYTIFRPGRLTNDAGSGNVNAAEKINDYGNREISRDNVATAVIEALDMKNLHAKKVELLDGEISVKEALQAI